MFFRESLTLSLSLSQVAFIADNIPIIRYKADQWRIYIVKFWTCPPRGPNSFKFMQFLGKFGKIVCWHPPGELVPPPQGNPRSATADHSITKLLQTAHGKNV